MIVHLVGISKIVAHYCLNFLFIIISFCSVKIMVSMHDFSGFDRVF